MKTFEDKKNPITPQVLADNFTDFIGVSPHVQYLRLMAAIVASDLLGNHVLITGEKGVGKEVLARLIHKHSVAVSNKKVFVACNCAAIPVDTSDSILFGHRKGAFTGSDYDHEGYFMQAQNGSLFMDEVGILPLTIQGKFLRAMQDHVIRVVGSREDTPFNCRLIFATNKNLVEMCENETFMSDLYDRINVLPIHILPLRQRKEDLPSLIKFMKDKYTAFYKLDRPVKIDTALQKCLLDFDYPGNVRQLENMFKEAFIRLSYYNKNLLTCDYFRFAEEKTASVKPVGADSAADIRQKLEQLIDQLFSEKSRELSLNSCADTPVVLNMKVCKRNIKRIALKHTGGNKSAAAKSLNLSRHQFDAND